MKEGRPEEVIKFMSAQDDPVWEMPLHKDYKKQLKSRIADIASCSLENGGSITAALFLQEFVKDVPRWVHIDTGASTPSYLSDAGRPVSISIEWRKFVVSCMLKVACVVMSIGTASLSPSGGPQPC